MVDQTFRPEYRILQAFQFKAVFDGCQLKAHSSAFTVLAIKHTEEVPAVGARIGFVVAKKKIKHAHDRNQFKRVVRDSFRRNRHHLPAIDIVFIAKQDAATMPKPELQQAAEQAWQQLMQKYAKLL